MVLLIITFLLFFLFPSSSVAVEFGKMRFNGFSFVTLTKINGQESNGISREHSWFVISVPLDSLTVLTVILAPEGPPHLLHDLRVRWETPIRGLDALTIGKFIPPFGWEYWFTRIDQTETVRYSQVIDPSRFVARDTGIQASGTAGPALHWDTAVFTGDRTGGNFPDSEKGNPDSYLRLMAFYGQHLRIGTSERFGPMRARAVDAMLRWSAVSVEAEGVKVQQEFDWFALVVVRLPQRITILYRYEDFLNKSYHTYGVSFRLNGFFWTKLNLVSGPGPTKAIGQLVIQW